MVTISNSAHHRDRMAEVLSELTESIIRLWLRNPALVALNASLADHWADNRETGLGAACFCLSLFDEKKPRSDFEFVGAARSPGMAWDDGNSGKKSW